jgi:hypothetical protein
MKIELKKIKNGLIGREGPSWQAELHIDGRKVAMVHQRGDGGEIDIRPFDNDDWVTLNKAEEYAKTLPPIHRGCEEMQKAFGPMEMDLRLLVDEMWDDWQVEKRLMKDEKKGVLLGYDRKGTYSMITWKGYKVDDLLKTQQGIEFLKTALERIQREKCVGGIMILNNNLQHLL